MQEYFIQRWDDGTVEGAAELDLEQYVPPEVEAIAWKVVENYDMSVSGMQLITAKPDKGGAIWRIETNKGPRSLKVLHRTPNRSLFSVGAQEYVVGKGARVPSLIATKDQMLYVEAGGKLWIVTDWIEPLEQVSKIDLEGASILCRGLGEFHHHTKGYTPPESAMRSTRLHGWPKYYEKIIAKIGWFRDIANYYPELPSSELLLSVVNLFDEQARVTLQRLKDSSYNKMVAMGELHWGLVHQDYGWSNGQMGPGGIWVIDLDGVSYDLPIRDLRKLITSTMDDMGVWDVQWMRGMIEAYHEANPLDKETFEVLLIDMAMPNEFYKHVKEIVFDPLDSMNADLEALLLRLMASEESKHAALAELASDIAKYESGNYQDIPTNYTAMREISFDFENAESAVDQDAEQMTEEAVPAAEPSLVTIFPRSERRKQKTKKKAVKNKLSKKQLKKMLRKRLSDKKLLRQLLRKERFRKQLKEKKTDTKRVSMQKKRKRASA